MADYDITAFANVLKIDYRNGLDYAFFRNFNLYNWFPKDTTFKGLNRPVTVVSEGTYGSNDYTAAESNAGVAPVDRFTVERQKEYHDGFLDIETMKASEGDKAALKASVAMSMDAAMQGCKRSTSFQLMNNGGGALGQISSTSTPATSATITLADPNMAVHFGRNMPLQASATDGTSGTVRTGTVTITGIDRKAGTLTVSTANWTGITGIAAGDYLFRNGDFGKGIHGVPAWIPLNDADVTATPFLGVDRTSDPVRLAGLRVDASGETTVDGLIEGIAQGSVEGASYDACWVNPKRFAEIQKSTWAKTLFEATVELTPTISIKALKLHSEMGDVPIMSDRSIPYTHSWLTRRKCWRLSSLGGWPHLATEHGFKYMTVSGRDVLQFKLRRMGNLECFRPLDNCWVKH